MSCSRPSLRIIVNYYADRYRRQHENSRTLFTVEFGTKPKLKFRAETEISIGLLIDLPQEVVPRQRNVEV